MNVFFAKFWIRVVRSMKNLPMFAIFRSAQSDAYEWEVK